MAPRLDPCPLPHTPSKRRVNAKDFDIWFLEFSNTYNLHLSRTPQDLSPQKQRKLPHYSELRYYEQLKVQYFRGKHEVIESIFDQKAKEIHSKWVKKPLATPGVAPYPTQLPLATTEPERSRLLETLRSIIEDVGSTSTTPRSSVSVSSSHQVNDEVPSPRRSRRSKRHSDEWPGSPTPKRTRSIADTECDPEDDDRPPSVFSFLDRGRVHTTSPSPNSSRRTSPVPSRLPFPPRTGPESGPNKAFYEFTDTGNMSKSTVTSQIFSDHDNQGLLPISQETQTTVVASNSANTKLPPFHTQVIGSDSDLFAPSSSTERALHISFNKHEDLQQNVRRLFENGSSTYSDFSRWSEPNTTHPISPSLPPASPAANSPVLSPIQQKTPNAPRHVVYGKNQNFEQRLHHVWPVLPAHYNQAPFAVRWEILRVALHCGIDMEELRLEYDPSLTDQKTLWARLQTLPIFRGKSLPERSRYDAWTAALNDKFSTLDRSVVLTATLTANTSKTGPPFHLKLSPLKLELSHRLSRRFGSDRFLELVVPSLNTPEVKNLGEAAVESIIRWLADGSHILLGRIWALFFVKAADPKKTTNESIMGLQTKTVYQERIYLFAEDGNDFHRLEAGTDFSPKGEPVDMHTRMRRGSLINWLLQVSNNQTQSVLKLFSRIALGLSRTHPTVILQPEQIRHRKEDVLSPTGNVMNDGIARMSRGLARAISNAMGLSDLPAGFQGRFGSAKGFWLRDTTDTSDDIWIETYPSQRKWNCDYIEDDHRTFEVGKESRELKFATLNLQLLPILEDRAINADAMKVQVGKFLRESLERDLDAQKAAMQDPSLFRLWVHENSPSNRRLERVNNCQVPFTAGLPTSREDIMSFLLDSGFDPQSLEFLRDIAWKLRMEKCKELQEKLHVRVGRSTYAYMVVDFLGVLEEDEIHLGFSSKFTDEYSGFSETFLHGIDVLVARTPAHYPSDIQKVKAVFKPELGSLKDVVIFPTRGDIPLADKLSGGDYDGDIAWVCWEPTIVNNFQNAEMPVVPNLFQQGILRKESQTYSDLLGTSDVTSEFLRTAFHFNMQQNLLGPCTIFKEKFCYARKSVQDDSAILLSTLISNLVDRAKQGIVFTDEDWARLRRSLSKVDPPEPLYKKDNWSGKGNPTHIIDYVKFSVGKPTVEAELKALDHSLSHAVRFDKDLVRFYQHFEKLQRPPSERKEAERKGLLRQTTWEAVLGELKKDIETVFEENWIKSHDEWDAKIANVYDKWQEISPTKKVKSRSIQVLQQEDQAAVGLSNWDLLKASFCFKMYYQKSPTFVWNVTGRQLAHIKALCMSHKAGGHPILMIPTMYAGSRPDNKYVRALAARYDGRNLAESEAIDEEAATNLSDDEF
ncbi:RNA dependent RNA polymerase-domain-containing protein [Hypoxylon sp. FL1150]|nr:RNA dependent RNA polymerase-domain-containing protein [Hypoxylon sp. FL1150]